MGNEKRNYKWNLQIKYDPSINSSNKDLIRQHETVNKYTT